MGEAPTIPFTAWRGRGRDRAVGDPDEVPAKGEHSACRAAMRTPDVEEGGGGWRRCGRWARGELRPDRQGD
jgi:hypothetical protein